MPRIVHIIQRLAPGGIENMALSLLQHRRPGDDVTIISLEAFDETLFSTWPVIKLFHDSILTVNKKPGKDVRAIFRLSKILRQLATDVVHTHHIGPMLYGGLAALAARIKTVVHTEHDAWHLQQEKDVYIQRVLNQLVKPVVVADSHYVAEQLVSHFNRLQPEVIHNGIDVTTFLPGDKIKARQQLGIATDKRWLGCAARLAMIKGQSYLIEALGKLPDDMGLLFAGSGECLAQYQQLAADTAYSQRIKWLGFVEDMPIFYQALDVFCLPSLMEGLPLALLEAQACNVPVVATDVGACFEGVCPQSGCLVPAGNSQLLAQAITEISERQSQQAPRDFIVRERSFERMLAAYGRLYDGHVPLGVEL